MTPDAGHGDTTYPMKTAVTATSLHLSPISCDHDSLDGISGISCLKNGIKLFVVFMTPFSFDMDNDVTFGIQDSAVKVPRDNTENAITPIRWE